MKCTTVVLGLVSVVLLALAPLRSIAGEAKATDDGTNADEALGLPGKYQ